MRVLLGLVCVAWRLPYMPGAQPRKKYSHVLDDTDQPRMCGSVVHIISGIACMLVGALLLNVLDLHLHVEMWKSRNGAMGDVFAGQLTE